MFPGFGAPGPQTSLFEGFRALRKPAASKKREPKAPTSASMAPSSARPSSAPGSARDTRKFRPPSSELVPRVAGVPSFLRLPVHDDPDTVPAVDVLLCGVPFDGGTAFRAGARF